MINAKEASRLLREMTPEDRLEALKNKVGEKTREALDKKIREVIASYQNRVELVLPARVCRDADKDIDAFLKWAGYVDIEVTSDFPAYCENYEGTTSIKFSIPNSDIQLS